MHFFFNSLYVKMPNGYYMFNKLELRGGGGGGGLEAIQVTVLFFS